MNPQLKKQLRAEANAVKECFTRFSFQALGLSFVVLGAVASYQPKQPLVGLSGLLDAVVLLTVSRIGTYKYQTANRHYAFELYCHSLATKEELAVSWEVALQAWRVIQATLYEAIYSTRSDHSAWSPFHYLAPDVVRRDLLACTRHRNRGRWFDPRRQVGQRDGKERREGPKWYPGGYLGTMQRVLHFMAAIALLPVAAMAIQLDNPSYTFPVGPLHLHAHWFAWALALIAAVAVALRIVQLSARRRILETGLLSITSSAMVWKLVIAAHLRADAAAAGDVQAYLASLGHAAEQIGRDAGCLQCLLHPSPTRRRLPRLPAATPRFSLRNLAAFAPSKGIRVGLLATALILALAGWYMLAAHAH